MTPETKRQHDRERNRLLDWKMFGEAKVQAKEERDSCSSNNTDLCKCTCIQKLKQQNEFQKLHRKVQEKRALFFRNLL